MSPLSNHHHQKGFSLFECMLAVAILAMVLGSTMSLQGTVVRILQLSTDKEIASIELNSTMAQIEYVINNKNTSKVLPKDGESVEWTSNVNKQLKTQLKNKISVQESDMKLSELFLSIMKMYYSMNEEETGSDENVLKFIANKFDTGMGLNKPTVNVESSVSWSFGRQSKKISEIIVLMNNQAIDEAIENFKIK